MKVFIALDASPHSARAVDFVRRIRWPAGSRVVVLSVVPPVANAAAWPFDPTTVTQAVLEEGRRGARVLLAQVAERLREAGISTEARLLDGDPRGALIEIAGNERADLLVVGSHGRTGSPSCSSAASRAMS